VFTFLANGNVLKLIAIDLTCQMRAREGRTDLIPIRPTDRHEDNFGHLQADMIEPMSEDLNKYALVSTDVQSRYVTAFELTAPLAKTVF
jgi:hypothetical protein